MFLQCCMWRSPASALNLRPQWGHGTKLGSGADGFGGGKSVRLLPLFWASVTTLACQHDTSRFNDVCGTEEVLLPAFVVEEADGATNIPPTEEPRLRAVKIS